MSFTVESASLEPKSGSKFIAGGEDMWVHVFDFFTGEEISKSVCLTFCHSHFFSILVWFRIIQKINAALYVLDFFLFIASLRVTRLL